MPAHKRCKFQHIRVQIDECCKFCVTYKYTLEFKLILFGLVKFSCYCNTVDGWISMWVDSIWAIFLRPIQLLWGHNVHSILGLLSTQSPTKKWLKLSTQDWVLNKSKFWVEIECSISAFFPYYHWVLNKSKFWVGIEYSISQFFYHLLSMEFVMNTQLLTFIVPYWVHNIPIFWAFFEYSI